MCGLPLFPPSPKRDYARGRFGDKAAAWIRDIAAARGDMDVELLDLRDYPMPFFNEPTSPLWAKPKNEVALRWGQKVAEMDGFIFVTAEYNHGIPAVLKNALDYAYQEFNRKPAAYVGYGGVGAARSIEHLRLVNIELQMAPTRSAVYISGADFMGMLRQGKTFADMPHLEPTAGLMLDDLLWWVRPSRAHGPRRQPPLSDVCRVAGWDNFGTPRS
jgi:NAD(P)H-dependent FMN reductase